MTDTHDTIDGLLAEFRGYAAGMPPSYRVTMSWHDFRKMLDRFEAAHKRELLTKTRENVNSGAASDTAGNGDRNRKYTTERHPWMSWEKCVAEYQKSKEAGEYGPY